MKKPMIFEGIIITLLIVLSFIMYIMVAAGSPSSQDGWDLPVEKPPIYMTVGDDGNLYSFTNDKVHAIGPDGSLLWSYTAMDRWQLCKEFVRPIAIMENLTVTHGVEPVPVFDSGDSMAYVYATRPNQTYEELQREYMRWMVSSVYRPPPFTLKESPSVITVTSEVSSNRITQYESPVTVTPVTVTPVDTADAACIHVSAMPYPEGIYTVDLEREYQRLDRSLIAISSEGKPLWNHTIKGDGSRFDDVSINARGDRVYLFHGYNETVLDPDGDTVFEIENVSSPAAVDDQGYVYLVPAIKRDWTSSYDPDRKFYTDLRTPSSVVQSYYPNGTLHWSRDIGSPILTQYVVEEIRHRYGTLPLYDNGTLYVPVENGIVALDSNGNIKWSKLSEDTFTLFEQMPFDEKGNVYLRYLDPEKHYESYVLMIGQDGEEVTLPRSYRYLDYMCAKDGVGYYTTPLPDKKGSTLEGLKTVMLTAHDLRNDTILWEYKMPVDRTQTLTVNESTVWQVFDREMAEAHIKKNGSSAQLWYHDGKTLPKVHNDMSIDVMPGKDGIFVSFRSYAYQYPVVLNVSKCEIAGGIYAIDGNGKVIWQKPSGWYVTSMAANNTTLYYSTGDGKISSTNMGLAAGITSAALLLVLIKFFFAGTISRARDRLGNNPNRIEIMEHIRSHPGATLSELSRELAMNIGTVRYHLLILIINRRIIEQRMDGKYVRYFLNAGGISPADRYIISLSKRDGMRKILAVLLEYPAMSNTELAKRTGLQESGVSRYMKELTGKGIVEKGYSNDSLAYRIPDRYRDSIDTALKGNRI